MTDSIRTLIMGGAQGYMIELTRYLAAAGGVTVILWLGARWTERRRIQLRTPDFADLQHEVINSLITMVTFAASTMPHLRRRAVIRMAIRSCRRKTRHASRTGSRRRRDSSATAPG